MKLAVSSDNAWIRQQVLAGPDEAINLLSINDKIVANPLQWLQQFTIIAVQEIPDERCAVLHIEAC